MFQYEAGSTTINPEQWTKLVKMIVSVAKDMEKSMKASNISTIDDSEFGTFLADFDLIKKTLALFRRLWRCLFQEAMKALAYLGVM